MAAPAPLANRDGSIGNPERDMIAVYGRSYGWSEDEIRALQAAYDRRTAPKGPDWRLEIDNIRQELERQGMRPDVIEAAVRMMTQNPDRNPGKRPLVDQQGRLPGEAQQQAAREIMGPAPGKSKQLAGRDPGFMQDQQADTFQYRQPDLNRRRPDPAASIQFERPPQPVEVPPMLDRNRAPFLVRKPDGSFEMDPTWGEDRSPAGPEAPPLTAREPPFLALSSQHGQRHALYNELAQAIQGRIAPAPGNLAGTMGDAYVLDQLIPALRERYADRPDVLARLDEIQAYATRPDALTRTMESVLPATGASPGRAMPVRQGLDENGFPVPLGDEGARWARLPTRELPRPPALPGTEAPRSVPEMLPPPGEAALQPVKDQNWGNPQEVKPGPYKGPLRGPKEVARDQRWLDAENRPWNEAINPPDPTDRTTWAARQTVADRSAARAEGMDAPDIGPKITAAPPPVRPVPTRPQEFTAANRPADPAQQVDPRRLPPGELGSAKARIQMPPGGKVLGQSGEFPASGRPSDWGAEWGARSVEPSFQSSTPGAPTKPGTPRGGSAAVALEILGQLGDRYGSTDTRLSNEQLRQLLMMARGTYPAGGAAPTTR